VVASKSIQWVEGIYVFNNETLDNIMKTLSRWYDFNYWFEEQSLKVD
jgi:transmembrane sensor